MCLPEEETHIDARQLDFQICIVDPDPSPCKPRLWSRNINEAEAQLEQRLTAFPSVDAFLTDKWRHGEDGKSWLRNARQGYRDEFFIYS